jgi:hypothetical protein
MRVALSSVFFVNGSAVVSSIKTGTVLTLWPRDWIFK